MSAYASSADPAKPPAPVCALLIGAGINPKTSSAALSFLAFRTTVTAFTISSPGASISASIAKKVPVTLPSAKAIESESYFEAIRSLACVQTDSSRGPAPRLALCSRFPSAKKRELSTSALFENENVSAALRDQYCRFSGLNSSARFVSQTTESLVYSLAPNRVPPMAFPLRSLPGTDAFSAAFL